MLDPIEAVSSADPYPFYAALAGERALVWGKGMWLAASPALVTEVLGNPSCQVRPLGEPVPTAIAGGSAGEVFGALVRMNDGAARHDVPKLVLQRALGKLSLDEVRAAAARIAIGLQEELMAAHAGAPSAGAGAGASGDAAARGDGAGAVRTSGAGPAAGSGAGTGAGSRGVGGGDDGRGAGRAAELSRWVAEVPVRTVASLLGFADERLAEVAAWMGRFVACLSPLSSAQQIASAHAASVELLAALRALMAAPGGLREGSLLQSVWCEAADAGWREERAILANLVGLMSQTHEATAGLIGNTLVALQRGAPWPSDAASALRLVREVAVNDPPVQNTRRFVAEDAHIGGVDVKQGQMILVVLAAAGKGFGHGAHACPGQAMAETIAAAAIAGLPAPPGPMRWRYRPSVNARIPEFVEVL